MLRSRDAHQTFQETQAYHQELEMLGDELGLSFLALGHQPKHRRKRAGNYCLIPRDVTSFQYGSRLSAVIRRVACTKGKPLVGRWR